MESKELLELLATLQIKLTVKELERWIEQGDDFIFDPRVMAQVTTLLKHHEVKADIKEVTELKDMREQAIANNRKLLESVRIGEEDGEYVN